MLWEQEPIGECFHSFFQVLPNFHEYFYNLHVLVTWRTCFLFCLEITVQKFILIINISSTACVRCVFLSSYRNTMFNQSAHTFSLGYFFKLDY